MSSERSLGDSLWPVVSRQGGNGDSIRVGQMNTRVTSLAILQPLSYAVYMYTLSRRASCKKECILRSSSPRFRP